MADVIDPYKVLQVDHEAEDEVIQAAYRRLARKYHPDLAPTVDGAARMSAINAAWELIGEPAKRAAFDRDETRASKRAGAPASRDADDPSSAGDPGSAPASAKSQPGTEPPRPSRPTTQPSPPPPETVSRDWTSGRSTEGGGFDESMRAPEGHGAAGPPPGQPSGAVLNFGRYAGWSLGEVARKDIEYIEWLDRAPIGRNYRVEVDSILRKSGRRKSSGDEATERRGLFRRR
jgi:curved DNA-binding protein CbpA